MLKIKSLRQELAQAGMFRPCEARSWGKLVTLLGAASALFVAHVALPFWYSALLVPLTGGLCAVAAMIGHEGSHRGLSRSPVRNRLMYFITFPVLGGVSGVYWHHKHDIKHHAYPNVADIDPDISLWPMATSTVEYQRCGPARQWFQRNLQGALFWPLCLFMVWAMRVQGIAHLVHDIGDRGFRKNHALDVVGLSLHAMGWVVLPVVFFGWNGLLLYVAAWSLAGLFLSMVFAPAHMGLPVVEDPNDIWRLQFETTRNFRMPKLLSFFFIGLDYQLEHHLFPRIPHQKLPTAAKITKAWAARNGVPYHEIDYWDGIKDVTRFMGESWNVAPYTLAPAKMAHRKAA